MPIDITLLEKLKSAEYSETTLDMSYKNLNLEDMQIIANILINKNIIDTLILSGNPIGNDGIRLIISNQLSLKTIIAIDCGITFISFQGIHMPLRKLDLANNEISKEGIIELSQSQLEWLNLAGNELDDISCADIGNMQKIEYLILSHNRVGFKTCFSLSNNATLETLYLHNNKLSPKDIECLVKKSRIKALGLGGNQIERLAVTSIVNNRHLISLNLNNCNITDEHAALLAQHHTLLHLSLGYNQITKKSAVNFLENSLLSLNLCFNKLEDSGAKLLATHPTLTHLDLTGNEITFEGAIAFEKNTRLRVLNLNSNHIRDAIVALANNSTLKELYVADNDIGDAAYIFIANQTLDLLNLNYNNMSDTTIKKLQENCHIKQLSFLIKQPKKSMTDNMTRIFSYSDSPVFILDAKTRAIQICNAPYLKTFGYSTNDIQSKPLTYFMHPDDIEAELKIINEVKPTYTYENRFRCKDGSYRIMRWTTWYQDELMYGIGEDLTHYRFVQKQALIAERNKEDIARYATFISYLSHEIRNPCSGIVSLTDLCAKQIENSINLVKSLKQSAADKALPEDPIAKLEACINEMKEYLDDIRICATIQQQVLDNNLEIAKIREGKLKLLKKPFDLITGMKNIIKVFKIRTQAKNLDIQFSATDLQSLWVLGDSIELEQIIMNIVSNALKFTKTGGIYIDLILNQTTEPDIDILIKVRDTGIGMSEEELNRLFQRFSQANTSTGHEYGGSGLGLHIAQQKALLMRGDIRVESQKGTGSVFFITLKLPKCPANEIPVDEKSPSADKHLSQLGIFAVPPSTLTNINLLVAEDNAINQKVIGKRLTDIGYRHTIVSNGKQACDVYQSSQMPFDAIFMDIEMPEMGGIEATKKIRQYESINGIQPIPIIALTANAMEQDQKRGHEAGMNAYLTKPFNMEDVKSEINRLCKPYREKLALRSDMVESKFSLEKQPNTGLSQKLG